MKKYCYTNVSGYKIFDISRFKKTDQKGCPYVTDEEIINGKEHPEETVYVLRSNSCGLSQNTVDLFFDSNISILTKKDDSDKPSRYSLLYIDNVGNSISAAKRNDSKSFVFIAENEIEDSWIRKLGVSLASGDNELSQKLYSTIFINVINDETVLYFDENKWQEVLDVVKRTSPGSKDMAQVTNGLKHLIVCNGISGTSLAKYVTTENNSQYVVLGTKSIMDKGFFLGLNKKETLCVIISALAVICIGYIMLRRN